MLKKRFCHIKKCEYSELVKNTDYTSYDEIYYDFKNEPTFLDTERENLTSNQFNPYDESTSNVLFAYDDGNGHSTDGIYGNDDRKFLNASQYLQWPYRGVCQIFMDFYNSSGEIETYIGTGALIGPNMLLTASHCVYSTELGWSTVVRAYPAYRNGSSKYSYASSIAAVIGVYYNTSDSNDDWAIIKLDSNIGNEVGYYGLEVAEIETETELKNVAYNGTTGLMSETLGQVYIAETYKFFHRIDAIAGSSGSPIFKGNSMNITGIHSAGIHEDNMDYNIACRVSKYLVNDWERLYK